MNSSQHYASLGKAAAIGGIPFCGAYGQTSSHSLMTLRARQDGLFDIIGTAFWALGTLFISYETGDVTTGVAHSCPNCPPGSLHLTNVLGRSRKILINRFGFPRSLAGTVSNSAVLATMNDVLLYDCLRGDAGHVVLRYMTEHGRPIDEENVLSVLRHAASDLVFELRFEPKLLAIRDELPAGKK